MASPAPAGSTEPAVDGPACSSEPAAPSEATEPVGASSRFVAAVGSAPFSASAAIISLTRLNAGNG